MEDDRHPRLAHARRARPVVLGLQRLPPRQEHPHLDERRDRAPDAAEYRDRGDVQRRRGVGPARRQDPGRPGSRQLHVRALLRLQPRGGQVGRQPRPGPRAAVRRHDARVGPLRGLRPRRLRCERARPHGRRLPDVLRPAHVQHRHDGVPRQGGAVGTGQGALRQEQHVQRRRARRVHERVHEAVCLHARRHSVRRRGRLQPRRIRVFQELVRLV